MLVGRGKHTSLNGAKNRSAFVQLPSIRASPKHVLSCNTRGEVEVLQFVAKADSSGYGGCSKAMGSKHHDWEHR